jgi:hypothetical protein
MQFLDVSPPKVCHFFVIGVYGYLDNTSGV